MKQRHGTAYGDFAGRPIELWSDDGVFYLVDPSEPTHEIRITSDSFQRSAQAMADKFASGWIDSPERAAFYVKPT